MKRFLIACCLAALPLRASADPDEATAMAEKAKHLQALIADLDSERPNLREDAATGLLAAGGDAIPYVIDSIYRKNAKLHLAVLEKLIAQERAALPPELRLSPDDLKAVVNHRLDDPKIATDGRKWLYAKYLEAAELYSKGHFDDAREKARAILTLDRQAPFADAVKDLERKCDDQHVGTYLVRLTATTMTPVCKDGDMIKVAFNATNMTSEDIEIWFGDPDKKDDADTRDAVIKNGSFLEVLLEQQKCEPDGGDNAGHSLPETKPLSRYSIKVKPGECLKLYELEFLAEAPGENLVKVFVSATMRVFRIDGREPMLKPRGVKFQPLMIRVLPPLDFQPDMENPLKSLTDAIDSNQPSRFFLLCNLMPDKDKPQAIEFVFSLLKSDKAGDYDKQIARNCLRTLTGKTCATDAEWIQWHDGDRTTAVNPGDPPKK